MLARRLVALATAALTALVGAVQPTVAAPDTVPVTFDFVDLRPGESRSQGVAVQVRDTGTVTDATLTAQGAADLTWDASLCDASGACLAFGPGLVGTTLEGGTWTITVSVTAGPRLQQRDRSQVVGHLAVQGTEVVPAPDGTDASGGGAAGSSGGTDAARTAPLAMTGVPVPAWLALALVVTASGAWLVVLGRRRRDDAGPG